MTYLDEATHIRPPVIGVDACDLCPSLAVGGRVDRLNLHLWLCPEHLAQHDHGGGA